MHLKAYIDIGKPASTILYQVGRERREKNPGDGIVTARSGELIGVWHFDRRSAAAVGVGWHDPARQKEANCCITRLRTLTKGWLAWPVMPTAQSLKAGTERQSGA